MRQFFRILPILALVPILMACGEKTTPSVPAATEEPAPVPAADGPAPKQLADALPDGFELPFAYNLRYDRTVRSGGATERRIQVDAIGLDAATAMAAVSKRFVAQGFRASDPIARAKGGARVVYRHRDGRHATATFWTPDEKKVGFATAESVVYVAWPLSAVPEDNEETGGSTPQDG